MSAFRGSGTTIVGGAPRQLKQGKTLTPEQARSTASSRIAAAETAYRETRAAGISGGAFDAGKAASFGLLGEEDYEAKKKGIAQWMAPAPDNEKTRQRATAYESEQSQTALTRLEEENRMRARGRASTILTGQGGKGLLEGATVSRRTLFAA